MPKAAPPGAVLPRETLGSLASHPLDLWRPAAVPVEDPVQAAPLSLRWLAEHSLEDWNEAAFPSTLPSVPPRQPNPAPRPHAALPATAPVNSTDATLVFRAAATEWLLEQSDKHPDAPHLAQADTGDARLITPEQLESIVQRARQLLGLSAALARAEGARRVVSIELCELMRPEFVGEMAGEEGGDAGAIFEYLCGDPGTARGEADLHRLLGLENSPLLSHEPTPIAEYLADGRRAHDKAAAPARTATQLAAPAAPVVAAGRAPQGIENGGVPQARDSGAGVALGSQPPVGAAAVMSGGAGVQLGEVEGSWMPSRVEQQQQQQQQHNITSHHGQHPAATTATEQPTVLGADLTATVSAPPEGAPADLLKSTTIAKAAGNGWRAVVLGGKVMHRRNHYVRFVLTHRDRQFTVGVVRPGFDPSSGDLPSGPGGEGWGFHPCSGKLAHNGEWREWDQMKAIRASEKRPTETVVGLLLDYNRGTLTAFEELDGQARRVGTVCDGLGGPLVWMVEIKDSGASVRVDEMDPYSWPYEGRPDPETPHWPHKPKLRFAKKYGSVDLKESSGWPGHGTLAVSSGEGLAVGVGAMGRGTHYAEFMLVEVPRLRIGVLMKEGSGRPPVNASETAKAWSYCVESGQRVHEHKKSTWAGMQSAGPGDLIGLLLESGHGGPGVLTLYKNGRRCGCLWDTLPADQQFQWIAEFGQAWAFVRILSQLPPRKPPHQPREFAPAAPPKDQQKQVAVDQAQESARQKKRTSTQKQILKDAGKTVGDESGTYTQPGGYSWWNPAPGVLDGGTQTGDDTVTSQPTPENMIAAIFERFDMDNDRYLNKGELEALEYEVDSEESLPEPVYRQLCSAVGADPRRGLDVAALTRFYELGEAAGELQRAYSLLFCQPFDALAPVAEWQVKDPRAVGGLPRLFLQRQPESATVPQTDEPDGTGAIIGMGDMAPPTREAWCQTGFGKPQPRPVVRYGAIKKSPAAGRHASIPSRYGKYGPGYQPATDTTSVRREQGRWGRGATSQSEVWRAGTKNPQGRRQPPLPRAPPPVALRADKNAVEVDAREHWRARAASRARVPLGNAAEEKAAAEKAVATAVSSLQSQQNEQATRLEALAAQLDSERMRTQLVQSRARNVELLERINAVSHVGHDLRNSLREQGLAATATRATTDLPAQRPRPAGGAPFAGTVASQPLYSGYPSTASSDFRRSLPLDALQPQSQHGNNLVHDVLARSIDMANTITFGQR
jgi:hypothetical protein